MKKDPYQLKDFIWSSHTTIASIIEESRFQNILDAGCDDGFIGACLKYSPKRLVGLDKRNVSKLPKKYHHFISHDLDLDLDKKIIKDKFDIIIFADILEHLQKPHKSIRITKTFLKRNGTYIISVPNMNFFLVRILKLCKLRPKMNSGLFDKTHIHDFTYFKLVELLTKNKLSIEKVVFIPIPLPLINHLFDYDHKFHIIFKFIHYLTNIFPNSLAYQIVVKTRSLNKNN